MYECKNFHSQIDAINCKNLQIIIFKIDFYIKMQIIIFKIDFYIKMQIIIFKIDFYIKMSKSYTLTVTCHKIWQFFVQVFVFALWEDVSANILVAFELIVTQFSFEQAYHVCFLVRIREFVVFAAYLICSE